MRRCWPRESPIIAFIVFGWMMFTRGIETNLDRVFEIFRSPVDEADRALAQGEPGVA